MSVNLSLIAEALKHSKPYVYPYDHYEEARKRHADADTELGRVTALLNVYRGLADGLSDMVKGGRLPEASIPDDYSWLVTTLASIAILDPSAEVED